MNGETRWCSEGCDRLSSAWTEYSRNLGRMVNGRRPGSRDTAGPRHRAKHVSDDETPVSPSGIERVRDDQAGPRPAARLFGG